MAISRKLSRFAALQADDVAELERIVTERVDGFSSREDVLREGDQPTWCTILISGWACRYKLLEDGRRQIVAILLPGDVCDYGSLLTSRLDHSIAALGPLTCGRLPRDKYHAITRDLPEVSRALLLDTLAQASIHREWSVNLGQRDAFERVAHLFCELFVRLQRVGLTTGNSCDFPLIQADLADAVGMTAVHVNRTIQEMRRSRLIQIRSKTLTIPNLADLQLAGLFYQDYLYP